VGVTEPTRIPPHFVAQASARHIMALPTELVGQITELGIDDFSFKRGRTVTLNSIEQTLLLQQSSNMPPSE
jgi:hypothetical protein